MNMKKNNRDTTCSIQVLIIIPKTKEEEKTNGWKDEYFKCFVS